MMSLSAAQPRLEDVPAILGLPPHKLFIGHAAPTFRFPSDNGMYWQHAPTGERVLVIYGEAGAVKPYASAVMQVHHGEQLKQMEERIGRYSTRPTGDEHNQWGIYRDDEQIATAVGERRARAMLGAIVATEAR